MNEQKLKPGHFWAVCGDAKRNAKVKTVVIDITAKGVITVSVDFIDSYFNDDFYYTTPWAYYEKLEPPTMRYMTNEEMAEFVLENPCIVRRKEWSIYAWMINYSLVNTDNPIDFLYKKRFSDDWQEFLTEDK